MQVGVVSALVPRLRRRAAAARAMATRLHRRAAVKVCSLGASPTRCNKVCVVVVPQSFPSPLCRSQINETRPSSHCLRLPYQYAIARCVAREVAFCENFDIVALFHCLECGGSLGLSYRCCRM